MTPPEGHVRVVVPARDEEASLGAVLGGLKRHVPYGILVVDDGSTDATSGVAREAGVPCLALPCNLGYGGAVQAGIEAALAEGAGIVVLVDADGQHPPDAVVRVLEPVAAGDADVAIGSRYCDGRAYSGPLGRRMGQRAFAGLTRVLTGQRVYDTTSGFKAIAAPACRAILDTTFLDLHMETIVRLSLLGYRVTEVPVEMPERRAGASMHGFASAWKYPAKTLLLAAVAILDAVLIRLRLRGRRSTLPGGPGGRSPA